MGLLDKLLGRKPMDDGFITDDEKELRDYETNEYAPESRLDENAYAEFIVNDTFNISGRGTVVVGTVTEGVFRIGDSVRLVRGEDVTASSVITGIEQFRKTVDSVAEGADAGLLLKDVERGQVKRNDLIKKV